jgi:hypothetical protein
MSEFDGAVDLGAGGAAKRIEAENEHKIVQLVDKGVSPLALTLAAVQARLQLLITSVIPPQAMSTFELAYEDSLAHHLNELLTAISNLEATDGV